MADPRELSAPELNRFIADALDKALSLPGRPREPEGWQIHNVSAEPDGTGLWISAGRTGDPGVISSSDLSTRQMLTAGQTAPHCDYRSTTTRLHKALVLHKGLV